MSLDNIRSLKRRNLSRDVVDVLRSLIVNGELSPGTHLLEKEISGKLNVSRGPVREAFRILETEGLVECYVGRGSFVTQISEKDIKEIYSLREILEEAATPGTGVGCPGNNEGGGIWC